MRIVGLPKSFYYVSRRSPIEMSEAARQRLWRLKTWQRLRAEGYSAQKAADLLRLPRSTLYRWQKRLDKRGLIGLEDGDRRPKRVRRPQWSRELAEAVLKLREEHPGMGKEKLWVLLRRKDIHTSISTVGRILKRLKARGVLREPPRNGITKRKRRLVRPYATRKPKEYKAAKPGDLVQVDTLDVRPLSNVHFKQFTARDMNSRWDVVEAYRSATAGNARKFLDTLIERAPFPVHGIQAVSPRRTGAPGPNGVDGGSEPVLDGQSRVHGSVRASLC
jgi:putative transposase